MALGAQQADVLRLVVGGAMRLVSAGLIVGFVASVVVSRTAAGLLQDWNTRDPIPYAAVMAVLAATALLATWIPARRATQIAPVVALRHD
jgi:putative ABC transport system permease protein